MSKVNLDKDFEAILDDMESGKVDFNNLIKSKDPDERMLGRELQAYALSRHDIDLGKIETPIEPEYPTVEEIQNQSKQNPLWTKQNKSPGDEPNAFALQLGHSFPVLGPLAERAGIYAATGGDPELTQSVEAGLGDLRKKYSRNNPVKSGAATAMGIAPAALGLSRAAGAFPGAAFLAGPESMTAAGPALTTAQLATSGGIQGGLQAAAQRYGESGSLPSKRELATVGAGSAAANALVPWGVKVIGSTAKNVLMPTAIKAGKALQELPAVQKALFELNNLRRSFGNPDDIIQYAPTDQTRQIMGSEAAALLKNNEGVALPHLDEALNDPYIARAYPDLVPSAEFAKADQLRQLMAQKETIVQQLAPLEAIGQGERITASDFIKMQEVAPQVAEMKAQAANLDQAINKFAGANPMAAKIASGQGAQSFAEQQFPNEVFAKALKNVEGDISKGGVTASQLEAKNLLESLRNRVEPEYSNLDKAYSLRGTLRDLRDKQGSGEVFRPSGAVDTVPEDFFDFLRQNNYAKQNLNPQQIAGLVEAGQNYKNKSALLAENISPYLKSAAKIDGAGPWVNRGVLNVLARRPGAAAYNFGQAAEEGLLPRGPTGAKIQDLAQEYYRGNPMPAYEALGEYKNYDRKWDSIRQLLENLTARYVPQGVAATQPIDYFSE